MILNLQLNNYHLCKIQFTTFPVHIITHHVFHDSSEASFQSFLLPSTSQKISIPKPSIPSNYSLPNTNTQMPRKILINLSIPFPLTALYFPINPPHSLNHSTSISPLPFAHRPVPRIG